MQPSNLEGVVNRHSWEWLFDLPDRLNVVIEVIDDRHMPVFPAGHSAAAIALRRMLTTGEAPLASAISDVLRSPKPAGVVVDGLQVICFGLSEAGVLVLARELGDGDSAAECHRDLELVGSWLAAALEASLTKAPTTIAVEPYRIASLHRILSEAMLRGSVRRVIGAFVEALGVWDDVLIRSYAAGAGGGFFPYVSPVGAPSASPAGLDDAIVAGNGRMVRLSDAEIDRLGLASAAGDVLILRLDADCLLVFAGTIDDHEQVRLTLYSAMLRESVKEVRATTLSRVKAAMTGLPIDEPLEEAAQTALRRLTAEVGTGRAALVVTTATGGQGLSVGETDLLAVPEHPVQPDRLVVTSSDNGSTLTIVAAREQLPFTSFEREIVETGAIALHSWVQAAVQGPKASERRRRFRPVDTLFDELAAEAVDAGQHVSVIVVSIDATAVRPGLLQAWLGTTRARLRAGDFAGALSDREIAVLLCDASGDHAEVVSARLKQLIQSSEAPGVVVQPSFGITSRAPASPFEGSLVGAARAGAAAIR